MSLLEAALNGNVQACWMYAVFIHAIDITQPAHLYRSICSISFHQPRSANTIRPTLPRPAPNSHMHKPWVCRLIAASLDMLCPSFVSLMCMHASTQALRALLDTGVGPDDQKDEVRIRAV